MIFQVTMKDPDTLHDAIAEAVDQDLKSMNLDDEEKDAIRGLREERTADVASQWFKYGEYLTVEIDTVSKTIKVVSDNE